jgi:hypothetical protein
MFHICRKCKRLILFCQSKGRIEIKLKNGKKKVYLCIDCAEDLLERAKKLEAEASDEES